MVISITIMDKNILFIVFAFICVVLIFLFRIELIAENQS